MTLQFAKRLSMALVILASVILFYGATIKTTLRIQKVKNDVAVEIAHTPQENVRWIYVTGNSPAFTTSSLIQSDGTECAILHRLVWRNVPKVGILEVRIDLRDSMNKIVETQLKQIILGPEPEQPDFSELAEKALNRIGGH